MKCPQWLSCWFALRQICHSIDFFSINVLLSKSNHNSLWTIQFHDIFDRLLRIRFEKWEPYFVQWWNYEAIRCVARRYHKSGLFLAFLGQIVWANCKLACKWNIKKSIYYWKLQKPRNASKRIENWVGRLNLEQCEVNRKHKNQSSSI